ncbi:MAG: DUF3352 domain-containing protein [Candidatus Dormibacteria bacterium]
MSIDHSPPPPPLPAPAPRGGRGRAFRAGAAGVAALLAGAAVAAGVLTYRFLQGSADSLVSLAPSDSAAYISVNLDPSAGQKLAADTLLNRFPHLSGSSRDESVNAWLDSVLAASGLHHADVRSWLGPHVSDVVLAGAPPSAPSSAPSYQDVVLLSSTDDSAAARMFTAFRDGPVGQKAHWSSSIHRGVTVTLSQGAPSFSGGWAITAHTVVIGSDEASIDEVIDTAQGAHPALTSTADYTTTVSELPADRLALVYVDLPTVVGALPRATPGGSVPANVLSGLAAFRGAGAALVASSDGVTLTTAIDDDPAKLSAAQAALASLPAHVNGMLGFVPAHAYGFEAFAGLPQLIALIGSTPGAGGILDQLGITGPSGVISHLAGDGGLEIDKLPTQSVPAGALLIDTDSAASASTFLSTLANSACGLTGACDPTQATTQLYRGVTITSLGAGGLAGSGVNPSWAVSGHWAILASSADEVRAVLDARAGIAVSTAPHFSVVTGHVGTSDNGLLYVDIHSVVAAIRTILPPDALATFDSQVAPYLAPLQALGISTTSSPSHTTSTAFLLVG